MLFFEGLSCSDVIYAEMKDGVREGLHIKCKKEEKELVTAEEERKFWEMNLLGTRAQLSHHCIQCIFTMEKSFV